MTNKKENSNEGVAMVRLPKNEIDLDSHIILPGRKHGSYEYPDMLIPINSSRVQEGHFNSLLEENPGDYVATLRQVVDFSILLYSGKVFNGLGKRLGEEQIGKIRNPFLFHNWTDCGRGLRLDTSFNDCGRVGTVDFSVFKGDRVERITEDLGDILEHGILEYAEIDLNSWLKTADEHGLPTKKTKHRIIPFGSKKSFNWRECIEYKFPGDQPYRHVEISDENGLSCDESSIGRFSIANDAYLPILIAPLEK